MKIETRSVRYLCSTFEKTLIGFHKNNTLSPIPLEISKEVLDTIEQTFSQKEVEKVMNLTTKLLREKGYSLNWSLDQNIVWDIDVQ